MTSYYVTQLLAQAECYNILATLYSKPESGVHDSRKQFGTIVKSTMLLKPKSLEMARKLRKTAFSIDIVETETEYNRLFTGQTTALAYPCSSAYISMESPEWITDIYSKAGFITEQLNNPPDHITTEMRFIHHLLFEVAKGFQKDDNDIVHHFSELRCRFIKEHMIKWVPDFTRSILYNSKSPFYLQLAILSRTMLVNCTGENDIIPV